MILVDIARRTIRREQLAAPSTRVVAAISGGPDSIALLHVLKQLDARRELTLAGVVHLNHCLRPEADSDEAFCEEAARALGVPFMAERADVRAVADAERRSIEDAAHVVRHAFFERVIAGGAGDLVALGHTRDDQAETFLLRLIRGAGARGLASMHARAGIVIRPLLDASRADILAFLEGRRLTFVHDASNDDRSIPRNRVRADLLPRLARDYNPRIAEALAAHAALAGADEQLLSALVDDWCADHVRQASARRWTIDGAALATAPRAVGWRALYRAMRQAAGGRFVGLADVRRAWDVCLGIAEAFDAPGHRVQRAGPAVVLSGRPAGAVGRPELDRAGRQTRCDLPIPGAVTLPGTGWTVSAELGNALPRAHQDDRFQVFVPKERVGRGLAVRTRKPGDRLKASEIGHRKLQDLLVDRKVPRDERDTIPIVVDADDRVVWVAGHALNREFRVSDPAQAVVILRLKGKGVGGSF